MKFSHILLSGLLIFLTSCNEDEPKLPPVDERVDNAISSLIDELTSPVNGWKLQYQPTPNSGFYLMFFDFNEDGLVHVQTDLADNNGEFLDQTLQYRVDSGLGLELIMETYGAFHYLFEQNLATFGAEFEFLYSHKDGDNLIFQSKTDFEPKTVLTFIPAAVGERSTLSAELAQNINIYDGNRPRIFGGVGSIQQIIFNDHNFSLFWEMDIPQRTIIVDLAGVGTGMGEILANTDNVILDHTTAYSFSGGRLVLSDPVSFNLRGQEFTISDIQPSNLDLSGDPLCTLSSVPTPVMTGTSNLGSITFLRSTFDSEGLSFQPMPDRQYSVNAFFIFSNTFFSLQESGSIAEKLPGTLSLFMNYGFTSEEGLPENAIGFMIENDQRARRTIYRGFDPTTTVGNRIQINLNDEFFVDGVSETGDEQSLREITDEIFGDGEVLIFGFPQEDVFHLFNPCNGYEFFLVR